MFKNIQFVTFYHKIIVFCKIKPVFFIIYYTKKIKKINKNNQKKLQFTIQNLQFSYRNPQFTNKNTLFTSKNIQFANKALKIPISYYTKQHKLQPYT